MRAFRATRPKFAKPMWLHALSHHCNTSKSGSSATLCFQYHPGNNLRVFFGRAIITGGNLELALRNEGKFWYKVPCCCFLVDGCCYFLVAFCPSAHDSPSAVNIGGLEDLQRTQCQLTPRLIHVAHSHCMQRAENPPLLQPMRGAHILTHRILKIEGNIWYELGFPNLSTSNLSLSKIFPWWYNFQSPNAHNTSISSACEKIGIGLNIPWHAVTLPWIKHPQFIIEHRLCSFIFGDDCQTLLSNLFELFSVIILHVIISQQAEYRLHADH